MCLEHFNKIWTEQEMLPQVQLVQGNHFSKIVKYTFFQVERGYERDDW